MHIARKCASSRVLVQAMIEKAEEGREKKIENSLSDNKFQKN
jgi:hypothetical protein